MKICFVFLSLFLGAAVQAAPLHLNCTPTAPPSEQGAERYVHVEFNSPQDIRLQIASAATPLMSVVNGLELRTSTFGDNSSYAMAAWREAEGLEAVTMSFVYFGTWWGGHLHFGVACDGDLHFAAGEEYDLHCVEVQTLSRIADAL